MITVPDRRIGDHVGNAAVRHSPRHAPRRNREPSSPPRCCDVCGDCRAGESRRGRLPNGPPTASDLIEARCSGLRQRNCRSSATLWARPRGVAHQAVLCEAIPQGVGPSRSPRAASTASSRSRRVLRSPGRRATPRLAVPRRAPTPIPAELAVRITRCRSGERRAGACPSTAPCGEGPARRSARRAPAASRDAAMIAAVSNAVGGRPSLDTPGEDDERPVPEIQRVRDQPDCDHGPPAQRAAGAWRPRPGPPCRVRRG